MQQKALEAKYKRPHISFTTAIFLADGLGYGSKDGKAPTMWPKHLYDSDPPLSLADIPSCCL